MFFLQFPILWLVMMGKQNSQQKEKQIYYFPFSREFRIYYAIFRGICLIQINDFDLISCHPV